MISEARALQGKVFGEWTVGRLSNKKGHASYYCTCSCGNTCTVEGRTLLSGMSTRCGVCRSRKPRPGGVLKICRQGHDLAVCGKYSSGGCSMCRWLGYIKRTYGLTGEEYLALYDLQEGKCAICHKPLLLNAVFGRVTEGARTEIDHKHIPKKVKPQPPKRDTVRGLLCGGRYAGCNAKLGHVDNLEWLKAAANYLSVLPAQQVLRKE